MHETLAPLSAESAAHPEALAEITSVLVNPTVFPTPDGFSHRLNPLQGHNPSLLETPLSQRHTDFSLGRQNPPIRIQKWGERGEIKILPSEHKRITFLLHPTVPSPPSLHFLLLLFLILFQVWQPMCFFFLHRNRHNSEFEPGSSSTNTAWPRADSRETQRHGKKCPGYPQAAKHI